MSITRAVYIFSLTFFSLGSTATSIAQESTYSYQELLDAIGADHRSIPVTVTATLRQHRERRYKLPQNVDVFCWPPLPIPRPDCEARSKAIARKRWPPADVIKGNMYTSDEVDIVYNAEYSGTLEYVSVPREGTYYTLSVCGTPEKQHIVGVSGFALFGYTYPKRRWVRVDLSIENAHVESLSSHCVFLWSHPPHRKRVRSTFICPEVRFE